MSSSESTAIHPHFNARTAGVLLHVTSLPSNEGTFGIGDLGPTARRFAEWSATAGLRRWQMLPIGPVSEGYSPYSAKSSFAIEPMLTSVADLVEDGFLPPSALQQDPDREIKDARSRVSWRRARRWKQPRLRAAFHHFKNRRGAMGLRGETYEEFSAREARWLDDWCQYASRQAHRGCSSNESEWDPLYHAFLQFILDRQWSRLRRHAHERGLYLIGDLPFFCAPGSADVESRPDLFCLDGAGQPTVLTGVPPVSDPDEELRSVWGDVAVNKGQLWGHPHYNWAAHQNEDWAWWIDRVRTTLQRFDMIRIDHFVGFHHVFEILRDTSDPSTGQWRRTPGDKLLASLSRELGSLPFIAEDLGNLNPDVNHLRDHFGLVGMRILQSTFFDTPAAQNELPHSLPRKCVVYPATHDNNTVAGWYRILDSKTRCRFADYSGPAAATDPAGTMTQLAFSSPADMAIVQMQDLLGLGSQARMNRPGEPSGNWRWRMRRGDADTKLAEHLALLASTYKRHG